MVDWNRFVPSDFEYDFENDKLASHHVTINEAIECFYSDYEVRRNKKYRRSLSTRWPDAWRTKPANNISTQTEECSPDNHGMAFMTSNKKRTRKHLSDQSIDDIVEKQVTDDSAWDEANSSQSKARRFGNCSP